MRLWRDTGMLSFLFNWVRAPDSVFTFKQIAHGCFMTIRDFGIRNVWDFDCVSEGGQDNEWYV